MKSTTEIDSALGDEERGSEQVHQFPSPECPDESRFGVCPTAVAVRRTHSGRPAPRSIPPTATMRRRLLMRVGELLPGSARRAFFVAATRDLEGISPSSFSTTASHGIPDDDSGKPWSLVGLKAPSSLGRRWRRRMMMMLPSLPSAPTHQPGGPLCGPSGAPLWLSPHLMMMMIRKTTTTPPRPPPIWLGGWWAWLYHVALLRPVRRTIDARSPYQELTRASADEDGQEDPETAHDEITITTTTTTTTNDDDDAAAVSPGLWMIKRTFQPSILRKKRKMGFMVRQRTVGGRRTLARRRAKGRARLGGGI